VPGDRGDPSFYCGVINSSCTAALENRLYHFIPLLENYTLRSLLNENDNFVFCGHYDVQTIIVQVLILTTLRLDFTHFLKRVPRRFIFVDVHPVDAVYSSIIIKSIDGQMFFFSIIIIHSIKVNQLFDMWCGYTGPPSPGHLPWCSFYASRGFLFWY